MFASAPASAGAWTRPAGSGLTITTASYHDFAVRDPGAAFSKVETAIYAEYGLNDRVTLIGRLAHETRSHRSQRRVTKAGSVFTHSFTRVTQGWGELETGVRLRALDHHRWTLSSQLSAVRVPGEPERGLDDRPVWGADARLLLGRSFGTRLFADMQVAHRTRFSDDRNEQRLDLTFGVRPSARWLVMAQTYSAWGETGAGRASESHRVHLSVTAPVTERLSLQLGAINSLYHDGISPERAYMAALWREF